MKTDSEILGDALAKCGPNARAILVRHAARLTAGAAQYGSDFDDGRTPRDMLFETLCEISDGVDYIEREIARLSVLGPAPTRLLVIRTMLTDAERLAQAEYAERRAARATIPEAAE